MMMQITDILLLLYIYIKYNMVIMIPLLIQYYSYDTHYKIFEHEVYFNNKKITDQ